MSRENLELVMRGARLFEAGDWKEFESLFTPDAVLRAVESWPEPGPFFGRAAVAEEFRRLRDSWGANRIVIEDHTDRDDWLVLRVRWIVEGASSGVGGDITIFAALRFEDGQIAEYNGYWEHAEALEVAGLSE